MKLRVAKKVNRRNAELDIINAEREAAGQPPIPKYRRSTMRRCFRRMERYFALERKHACVCGRQRPKPSDKKRPCSFEHCPTHAKGY